MKVSDDPRPHSLTNELRISSSSSLPEVHVNPQHSTVRVAAANKKELSRQRLIDTLTQALALLKEDMEGDPGDKL
ncbi:hypothetical protein FisN_8Lu388 [Fistulifera solaris]|uniref:Uncharacterized protein n=1 Tax=Fistulifera solaris TaxID=1519565 RepID=A0A1Z5JMY3_FISSO|nr:hypothetical protein FisN_8Lu388 [Fistulifera solaris]|eukprot:GAX15339.1 hypothetical protein FisN_8Lu388 [Fistulifera solaris]